MDAREALWEELLGVDGATIALTANRQPEQVEEQDRRSGQPSFLSREGLEQLTWNFQAWLVSRFMRHQKSVKDVEVLVTVKFDGEVVGGGTITVPYRPQPVIDGGHRRG